MSPPIPDHCSLPRSTVCSKHGRFDLQVSTLTGQQPPICIYIPVPTWHVKSSGDEIQLIRSASTFFHWLWSLCFLANTHAWTAAHLIDDQQFRCHWISHHWCGMRWVPITHTSGLCPFPIRQWLSAWRASLSKQNLHFKGKFFKHSCGGTICWLAEWLSAPGPPALPRL